MGIGAGQGEVATPEGVPRQYETSVCRGGAVGPARRIPVHEPIGIPRRRIFTTGDPARRGGGGAIGVHALRVIVGSGRRHIPHACTGRAAAAARTALAHGLTRDRRLHFHRTAVDLMEPLGGDQRDGVGRVEDDEPEAARSALGALGHDDRIIDRAKLTKVGLRRARVARPPRGGGRGGSGCVRESDTVSLSFAARARRRRARA